MSNARRSVHKLTRASAADRGCFTEVTGTVEKVIRRKTSKGNVLLLVDVVTDDMNYRTRLRYLQVRQPIPVKGQHVSISGIPMELKGRFPTNIGVVRVKIG